MARVAHFLRSESRVRGQVLSPLKGRGLEVLTSVLVAAVFQRRFRFTR